MVQTSATLIERLHDEDDTAAWQRFAAIYTPLMRSWLGRQAVTAADADDLVQEVLIVVLRKLPTFEHNGRDGAFRHWLRRITVNCLRDFWQHNRIRARASGDSQFAEFLDALTDPASDLSRQWDREHDVYVTRQLLKMIRDHFETQTWQVFERLTIDEIPVQKVASEFGISASSVYVAKSRVMAKLREESDGLIQWDAETPAALTPS